MQDGMLNMNVYDSYMMTVFYSRWCNGGFFAPQDRMYNWGVWTTRIFVRDSFKSLFPDRSEEIEAKIDPGEYGVERTLAYLGFNFLGSLFCCFLLLINWWSWRFKRFHKDSKRGGLFFVVFFGGWWSGRCSWGYYLRIICCFLYVIGLWPDLSGSWEPWWKWVSDGVGLPAHGKHLKLACKGGHLTHINCHGCASNSRKSNGLLLKKQ